MLNTNDLNMEESMDVGNNAGNFFKQANHHHRFSGTPYQIRHERHTYSVPFMHNPHPGHSITPYQVGSLNSASGSPFQDTQPNSFRDRPVQLFQDTPAENTSMHIQQRNTSSFLGSPGSSIQDTAPMIDIKMVTGSIVEQKVDVIVVRLDGPELNLKKGYINTEIRKVAGHSLLTECRRKYPNGLLPGQIAVTSGGILKCKKIYHICLPLMINDFEKQLKDKIHDCLRMACRKMYKSIAFPLLGAGRYPEDTVVDWLFECFHKFDGTVSSPYPKEARIVVLPACLPRIKCEIPTQKPKPTRKKTFSLGGGMKAPSSWEYMDKEEFVKTVRILPTEKEFAQVSEKFRKWIWMPKIITIERIQNRTLHLQYMAMKRQLERDNPGKTNEMVLWHGTTKHASTSINAQGFNRSYCGKNATAFGEGVYFARDARYSAHETYSPRDCHDLKRMYQAKVLTGVFTNGDPSYKMPPLKDSTRPHDRYDSVVDNVIDPGIFVIFKDAQAYPSYLITFRQ